MVTKTYILQNLNQLESMFNSASTTKKQLYYSKLAIIELCGWTEETMDDIVLKSSKRILKDPNNISTISTIVKKTYGFHYDNHFTKMLAPLIGWANLAKIEKKMDTRTLTILRSTLNSLAPNRNSEAHTHLKGITRRIDAPSVTNVNFTHIYKGLKEFDTLLRSLKF